MKNNLLYINGQCLERELTGVERYTLSVLREMDAMLADYDVQAILLVPPGLRYELDYEHIEVRRVGRYSGARWEQLELPRYARGGYLLSLHSVAPLLHGRHQLVVMHDAKVAQSGHSDERTISRLFYLTLGRLLGQMLPRIVTISNFAKADIIKGFHVAPEKLTVVLNGVDIVKRSVDTAALLAKLGLSGERFVLGVGGGSTKNNILTARAVEQLDGVTFVLAGHAPERVKTELAAYSKTKLLGKVSDDELYALYEGAACLAFPSLVEGFGLPPIEAMAHGLPVVASRMQAVPEVCGDAALYVDAYDVDDMRTKLAAIISDATLRQELIAKGYENITRFDWQKTARSVLDIVLAEMGYR